MNSLGYKSFFASIAITFFASNSFAMNSADQGLENAAVIQQAVEVLRQDPEATKLVSELKNNSDDKAIMGRLMQRLKEILAPHRISLGRIKELAGAVIRGLIVGAFLGAVVRGSLNYQLISSASADCIGRGYDGVSIDLDLGNYSCL